MFKFPKSRFQWTPVAPAYNKTEWNLSVLLPVYAVNALRCINAYKLIKNLAVFI